MLAWDLKSDAVLRTWNDKSLASHDEDDLHRTKPDQTELPSLIQGDSKLCDEDCGKPADADRLSDGRCTS